MADFQQREQALDVTQSYIVQAPAGSGKTELLTQRFLKLLSHCESPENVLAITFTKKAVSEMRERILKALKRAQTEPKPSEAHHATTWQLAADVLKQDEAQSWNLIENPNRLRIQTIDSLCSKLNQSMPLLSQFGSSVAITEDASPLYQQATEQMIQDLNHECDWKDDLERLLLHCDNKVQTVIDLCVRLLAKRDQWLFHIHQGHERDELEQNLKDLIDDKIQDLLENFEESLLQRAIEATIYSSKNLDSEFDPRLSSLADFQRLANTLLTKTGSPRKSFDKRSGFPSESKDKAEKEFFKLQKDIAKALIEDLKEHEELIEALCVVQSLPNPEYADDQWSILQALIKLLPILCAKLQLIFIEESKIDYVENALGALRALGDSDAPTDIALYLDHQIHHILIDEFQDTSTTQWRLLEKLTANWEAHKTLFIVGDPMQSIYRFREAEVGLFLRAKEFGINHIHLNFLALKNNFRSTHTLVNWFNQHFGKSFPQFANINQGAIDYHESTATSEESGQQHFTLFDEDSPEAEAEHIAKMIAKRPNQSIAILVRAKSHLRSILPALQQHKIAYQAVDIETLAHKPQCFDLFHLTRAYCHPQDRTAQLAVMRMPFIGIKLADLNSWAIHEELERLTEDGKERMAFLQDTLNSYRAQRLREPLHQTIEKLWHDLGGHEVYTSEQGQSDAAQFFKLMRNFEQYNTITDLNAFETKLMQLFAKPISKSNNSVKIMSIHKSKGLEFDVVFLPQLQAAPRANANDLLIWHEYQHDNELKLLLAPLKGASELESPLYSFIKKQNDLKFDHEITRLLYVACTRAKTELIMTATHSAETTHLKSLLKSLTDHQIPERIESEEPLAELRSKRFYTRRVKLNKSQVEFPEDHQAETQYRFEPKHESTVGTVIHECLEILAGDLSTTALRASGRDDNGRTTQRNPGQDDNGRTTQRNPGQDDNGRTTQRNPGQDNNGRTTQRNPGQDDNGRTTQRNPEHKKVLRQNNNPFHCHSERNMAQTCEVEESHRRLTDTLLKKHQCKTDLDIANIIEQIMNDETGRWILHPHNEAHSEFAISGTINGEVKHAVIDRTFLDENNHRWIIDYKTVFSDQLNPAQYKQQLELYKTLWKQFKPDEEIKLAIYFPLQRSLHTY